MKCPKCGYLGFESVERCRNCGYDFSLTDVSLDAPELPMRGESWQVPSEDLPLAEPSLASESEMEARPAVAHSESVARRVGQAPARGGNAASAPASDELPLFDLRHLDTDVARGLNGGASPVDDEPLIKKASPPRSPLAVRRATPDASRIRTNVRRTPSLDLGLDLGAAPPTASRPADSPEPVRAWPPRAEVRATDDASLAARLGAAAVDALVLAAVDVLVVYFTMQICGIRLNELGLLPKGPLLAFLLVQNGGYLTAFTASGQTLGKMVAGIRVVATPGATLNLGRAAVRTFVWFLLAIPAGLGFLTAVFSADHRGLHDRLASTRVVRAA